MIYFTRYVHNQSTKVLRLHYNEMIGKVEGNGGRKCLMVDDYMQDIVLHNMKKIIDIETFLMKLRF